MLLADWLELEKNLDDMEAALKSYSERDFEETWYLGHDIYITASKEFPLVDIRHYWKPDPNGDFVPTTIGLKLNRAKLQNLKNIASVIRDYIPQLMFQVPAEYPNLSTDINIQSLEGLLNIPNLNC